MLKKDLSHLFLRISSSFLVDPQLFFEEILKKRCGKICPQRYSWIASSGLVSKNGGGREIERQRERERERERYIYIYAKSRLARKQNIGVKRNTFSKIWWLEECRPFWARILGVNFVGGGGVLKPWRNKGEKFAETFCWRIRWEICGQFS